MFSIVSYQEQPREVSSVTSLLPKHLVRDTSAIIALLEEYYKHLNTDGLPSKELSRINTIDDIDSESFKYITQIENLIAKDVGNSEVLDKVQLFRNIVNYYNTRGSEDSIHIFFRLFYDSLVDVYVPRQHVFVLSGTPQNSVASSYSKLQDGRFWTTFAYQIISDIEPSKWRDRYLKLAHPAGFMMFALYKILIFVFNEIRNEPFNLSLYAKSNPETWLELLRPKDSSYQHSPIYQPGWIIDYIIKIYAEYIKSVDENTNTELDKTNLFLGVMFAADLIMQTAHFRPVHEQFIRFDKELADFKFSDGFANVSISDFDAPFSNKRVTDLLVVGAFISSVTISDTPSDGYTFIVTDTDNPVFGFFNEQLEVNLNDLA